MSSSRASTAPPAESQEEAQLPSLATAEQQQLLDGLRTHDKLLVAQATYERGGNDWKGVAKLLKGHALLKSVFDAKRCEDVHNALTRDSGLGLDPKLPPQAPQFLKIARKWYLERIYELRELMQQEQDRFLITYAEIEEIKAGKQDDQIHLSHSSVPTTAYFPGLISPDLSKPAPLPMFVFPSPSASPGPAKKGRGGGRRGKAAAPTEKRDEWLDWKPQEMPEVDQVPPPSLSPSILGALPPLPDLGVGEAGPMGLQFGEGMPLPALPDLPPLPDLPQDDAMEGVEAA